MKISVNYSYVSSCQLALIIMAHSEVSKLQKQVSKTCTLVTVREFEDDCRALLNPDSNDIAFSDVIARHYSRTVKTTG